MAGLASHQSLTEWVGLVVVAVSFYTTIPPAPFASLIPTENGVFRHPGRSDSGVLFHGFTSSSASSMGFDIYLQFILCSINPILGARRRDAFLTDPHHFIALGEMGSEGLCGERSQMVGKLDNDEVAVINNSTATAVSTSKLLECSKQDSSHSVYARKQHPVTVIFGHQGGQIVHGKGNRSWLH